MKTNEEIIAEVVAANYDDGTDDVLTNLLDNRVLDADDVRSLMAAAIDADRAQHVGVYVPSTVHEPDAMFLREVWINGEAADGTKLDMTRTWGGAGMVLEITKPDGSRIVESINASEFTQAWAAAAEARV